MKPPMSIWKKIFGQTTEEVDYYEEGLVLLGAGKYHEALTSFRLALRHTPDDTTVLQQIAIAYTRIGMTDEAIRTYRKVLQTDAQSPGAHYGLAFLYLRNGQRTEAIRHLRSFLVAPPGGAEANQHIEHARQTLESLESGDSTVEGALP